ncbi:MAG: glycosyltransferase family 2 protein [Candidatus Kapabacteria bacterium]|nr:glycosyltransferase family 2 protein [Ignavibacteriota bacterium]MCW5883880.1 glycosyltransferase family 2 protein [Candidatus Kapabacteria bacterium]
MPCLNEEETVHICVWKARTFMNECGINGEVIIADNGSTDRSALLAANAGARVVNVKNKGYGSALMGGINAARGKYIIMADSDDSYDFLSLMPFVEKLRLGCDFVIGNRFKQKIASNAMPFLHKYLGNPILTFIGKSFFKSKIGDFHCGLRGFSRKAFDSLELQTTGMEFASEMIVKATLNKCTVSEVPVKLYPDGRSGKSHLNTWGDGWRHLRFLLLYSPRWLFLYPGLMLMLIGFGVTAWSLPNPRQTLDIHSIIFAVGALLIGFQAVFFAVFTKSFAVHERLLLGSSKIEGLLDKISLETLIKTGILLILLGISGGGYLVYIWQEGTFFEWGVTVTMRIAIFSFTFMVFGFQIIFSAFFYSYLKLQVRK